MARTEETKLLERRAAGVTLLGIGIALALWATFRAAAQSPAKDPHSWQPTHWSGWLYLAAVGAVVAVAGLVVLLRAKALRRDTPHTLLTALEEAAVLDAIRAFERRTSGELHVHLSSMEGDVMAAARQTFEQLGMAATRERNGVLFFVAVPQRRFAVLGDQGIHEKVAENFWDEIARGVQARFARGEYGAGLCEGIQKAGEALATHFPPRADDINELPDQISRQ